MTYPPGPPAPALVQTLNWVLRPYQFMEYCKRKHGDVFTARFLVIGKIVFVADPDAIKQIFTGSPKVFHAGEANAGPLEPIMGRNSVLLLDEDAHLRQRRLMLPSFQGERMQRYGELMTAAAHREMETWPAGEPFSLLPHMQSVTLDVILRAVFGLEQADQVADVRAKLQHMLAVGAEGPQLALLPIFRNLPGPLNREAKFLRAKAAVDEALYAEIDRRRDDPAIAERDDVLSLLMQARDEDGNPMTNEELRDELMTLLLAGHETTATSLSWAMDQLLHHPTALERLRAELAAGGEEYLDAVVKETLRTRPVLPVVARKLTEPVDVKGHEIPAGAIVAPCIYLTHRLPEVYPDPYVFRPERFIERPAETYTWIPFGGGIRRCLGASFATFEMKTVLRAILERTELRPVSARPAKVRRRAITLVPGDGTRVVLERRHLRKAAAVPERQRVPA